MQFVMQDYCHVLKMGLDVIDKGNIEVPTLDVEKFNSDQEGLRNYDEIVTVSENLSKATSEIVEKGNFSTYTWWRSFNSCWFDFRY